MAFMLKYFRHKQNKTHEYYNIETGAVKAIPCFCFSTYFKYASASLIKMLMALEKSTKKT